MIRLSQILITSILTVTSDSVEEISFTTSDGTSRAVDDFSPKSVVRVEVSYITSVALYLDTPDVVRASNVLHEMGN